MVKSLIVDEYKIVDVGGRGGVELGRKLIHEPHTANTESE